MHINSNEILHPHSQAFAIFRLKYLFWSLIPALQLKYFIYVDLSGWYSLQNAHTQLWKYLVHILPSFRWRNVSLKLADRLRQLYFLTLVNIIFIPYDDYMNVFAWIVLNFFDPTIKTLDWLRVGQIVQQQDSNCVFIVCACDCSKCLLACLLYGSLTVSQICSLIILFLIYSFLVANSTPIVGWLSSLEVFLMKVDRRVLLPTDESPTKMYLNR